MRISNYKTTGKAFKALVSEDKDYILIKHTLKKGEGIKTHYHKKANEYLLIDNGKFSVDIGGQNKIISLKNKQTVINFPKNKKHSFTALSKVIYFVLRDCKDKTIYKK